MFLIQDAAQSLGSKVGKKDITEFADFTIFSFQAIKHITSGDGGMLTFKNKKFLEKVEELDGLELTGKRNKEVLGKTTLLRLVINIK